MKDLYWLWTKFWDLTWWQMILWVVYVIYFVVRTVHYWGATRSSGIRKGYKEVLLDDGDSLRVYHLLLMVFDIPPALLGLSFPLLRKILGFELHKFKKPEDKKKITELERKNQHINI